MCGTGKSTKIFEIMQEHKHEKWLYITPLLSEIDDRIKKECPALGFKTPTNYGKGKLSDLHNLIERGENVASTHVLFSHMTPEIVDLLIESKYKLVIDEAITCVGMLQSGFNAHDTKALLISEMVSIDTNKRGQLTWNEDKYPNHDGKYAEIRNMCHMGMLYCFNDVFLMFEYPPKLLSSLSDVYVLTYMFSGSDMRCWLDLNNIEYIILDNGELGLKPEQEVKDKVKELLTFYNSRKMNNFVYRNTSFSKSWYDKANNNSIKLVKDVMRSCVTATKAKQGEVFWTVYKDYEDRIAGAGFKTGVSKDMPAFLPMNTRATNDYRNYRLCMYGCNIFKNPVEKLYLASQGVVVDEDAFALSEMIQFLWRGCIRQYKPMTVFIVSRRMQKLLEAWING